VTPDQSQNSARGLDRAGPPLAAQSFHLLDELLATTALLFPVDVDHDHLGPFDVMRPMQTLRTPGGAAALGSPAIRESGPLECLLSAARVVRNLLLCNVLQCLPRDDFEIQPLDG
jgi:hypothetical protein